MAVKARVVAAAAVALLLAGGCRPPLRRLTQQRAFDQALCAAQEHSRQPERDLEYVRGRIDAEARPRFHLTAVPRAELLRSLGPGAQALAEHAVVVRAIAAIDEVQVDDFQLRVVLLGPQGPIAPIPADIEAIAALTGESIPPAQVETVASRRRLVPHRFRQRPLLGMAAVALEISTLFMVPVTEATGHSRTEPGYTRVIEPGDAEVLAAAPIAVTLAEQAEALSHVRYEDGQEVANVWLWPRLEGELRIAIEWSYAAYGCAGPRPALRSVSLDTAEAWRIIELPLPPGPDLESRIAALFGDHMQPLVGGRTSSAVGLGGP